MALNNPQKINKTLDFQDWAGLLNADLRDLSVQLHNAHAAAIFVETNGSDTGTVADGSMLRPYATLAKALAEASAGDFIVLGSGAHTVTNLEISTSNLTFVSKGVGDGTSISGNVSIAEDTNKIKFAGIKISGDFSDEGTGQNVFRDVAVTGAFSRSDAGSFFEVVNSELNTVSVTGATAVGSMFVANTKVTGAVSIDSINHTVHFFGCPRLGTVTHGGGKLTLDNIQLVTKTTGNSVNSSATATDSGFLKLAGVNLKQIDGSYGLINKTGNCAYEISADTNRDEVNDVLTGTRAQASFAKDVAANFAPSAYSPAGPSVKEHLEAIATKLGEIDGILAGEEYVFLVGGHDASGGAYPTTGRQGGTIQAGDLWKVTVAGTLSGSALQVGDTLIALVDSPGNTAANWMVLQTNVDYATASVMGLVTLAETADVANATAAAANTTDVVTPALVAEYVTNTVTGVANGFRQQYTLTAGVEQVVTHNLNTENIIVQLVNPADGSEVTAFYDIDVKNSEPNTIGVTGQAADTIEVRIFSFRTA